LSGRAEKEDRRRPTYSIRFAVSKNIEKRVLRVIKQWELVGIQWLGLTNEASTIERKIFLVRHGERVFHPHDIVESLTDCTIGSVGTGKDVALVDRAVACLDGDLVFLLRD